jgi:hypothetical protein
MLKEDFVIQSNVRRILVRSNIDYTKFDFGTVKGVVYFRGRFVLTGARAHGHDQGITAIDFSIKVLSSLGKKVKALPGVTDVIFQFDNWRKDRGKWMPVGGGNKKEENHRGEDNDPALQDDSA